MQKISLHFIIFHILIVVFCIDQLLIYVIKVVKMFSMKKEF